MGGDLGDGERNERRYEGDEGGYFHGGEYWECFEVSVSAAELQKRRSEWSQSKVVGRLYDNVSIDKVELGMILW